MLRKCVFPAVIMVMILSLFACGGGTPVGEEEVVSATHFMDDLGADSLDHVELTMAMEEEFNVGIPDEDAENIETVQDAIDYVIKAVET